MDSWHSHRHPHVRTADGCVRSARQILMLGDSLVTSDDGEPLVTVAPDPWTNPFMSPPLQVGVSLVAPRAGLPCEQGQRAALRA